ncbi:MAG: type II toxin-antitoxin system RelE/ParE family toxin [Paraperlucidibaca sp.]|uniref:type II toxin-antitoxin system mRNA interferase toxin, RelE/StbE family n=1 Tax=Paraperlucidibaca sp. TaxID=2708021 RepID=UPI001B67BBD8|nr:type II toxin-antitoxin system RelE/ParE family toxin [Paraperlucidibaca sp.]MBQ0723517.1 type II toxin-antitoxin system RelE/ParE family toxin [Paraperlucidibaca sp.]MBQ0843118.1 type II toxin-antitoxin system RelE/ParE family toxin [Paraperlucidibaca sp.]
MSWRLLQTPEFTRDVKKLTKQQKQALDSALRELLSDPLRGELKVGDLAGVRVYKFHLLKQPVLLAYEIEDERLLLYLLKLGSHENFYRDLKR